MPSDIPDNIKISKTRNKISAGAKRLPARDSLHQGGGLGGTGGRWEVVLELGPAKRADKARSVPRAERGYIFKI